MEERDQLSDLVSHMILLCIRCLDVGFHYNYTGRDHASDTMSVYVYSYKHTCAPYKTQAGALHEHSELHTSTQVATDYLCNATIQASEASISLPVFLNQTHPRLVGATAAPICVCLQISMNTACDDGNETDILYSGHGHECKATRHNIDACLPASTLIFTTSWNWLLHM